MFKKLFTIALALSAGGAIRGQTIQAPYSSSYTVVNLGTVTGVPTHYGGITFLDPSTLLLAGASETSAGAIYTVPVTRRSNGHITRFGTPALYAAAPDIDGGLAFGPGGVLFATGYSVNTLMEFKPGSTSPDLTIDLIPFGISETVGTLQFVPAGMPGAGVFKIAEFAGTAWFDGTLTANGDGTYGLSVTPTIKTPFENSEGIMYVPPASRQFSSPSVLVEFWGDAVVYAFPVDSDGNPSGSGTEFMSLTNAEGATYDPITGDGIFGQWSGSNEIFEIQGFTPGTTRATAGASQSAIVNAEFGSALTVTVKDPFGQPVAGATVTFAAPASGATAGLSSTSQVTAADGTASVTATANATAGAYVVTATLYGQSATFSLTNVALSALTLSPTSVVGGLSTAANTVTLTSAAPASGATITLTSSNPAVAAVPGSVTVAGGSTVSAPFSISTTTVTATTHVTIKASDGANSKTGTLTVKPAALTAVNLSPQAVVGGKSTTGNTVTLNGPAPAAGAVVNLSSSDPTVAAPPASVTVAAGATTSPAFTITTTAVASDTPVTVSATYGGVMKTANLTVDAPQVSSLRLSPSSVKGGRSTTRNTVTLNGPAPAGGAQVLLTSGDPGVASPPTSVTVAAGSTSATFTITTTAVESDTVVAITATFGGASKSANLAVTP